MLPNITDLYHQFDARFPHGYYRSPSLITSLRGTLLAFAYGKYHRTDSTPNQIFLRRSEDDGITWTAAREVIYDTTNRTEFYGAPLLDAHTGRMTYLFALYKWHTPAIGCALHSVASDDDGKTWSQPKPIAVNGRANSTWGSALASGITLTRGPNAGRLLLALRSDCGVVAARTSFVIYSDDHGATWTGGERMELLPQFGGGWTECQVAELYNGSVLMTSRNFYGASSGQGPRLFARSDDGGATWAANWSATETELPDPYCEGSILADPSRGLVYFGNPSNAKRRGNYSVHVSSDGGRTWPVSRVLYPGGAAYSDLGFTRAGKLAFLFERDNYNTVAFGVADV